LHDDQINFISQI
jgi:hypothetical protein